MTQPSPGFPHPDVCIGNNSTPTIAILLRGGKQIGSVRYQILRCSLCGYFIIGRPLFRCRNYEKSSGMCAFQPYYRIIGERSRRKRLERNRPPTPAICNTYICLRLAGTQTIIAKSEKLEVGTCTAGSHERNLK